MRTSTLLLLVTSLLASPLWGEDIFSGKLKTIWEEGGFTEGAAVGPDGCLYFSDFAQPFDARPARIMKFNPLDQAVTIHCADSKMANGLMFDRMGNLYACCASPLGGRRALVQITPKGKVKPVVETFNGKRFNSPNDIVIDARGRIYFSDPKYVGPEEMELPSMDVYRLDPDGKIHRATKDIDKPNGVMLAPDGKTMYVAETDNGTDKADIVSEAKRGRMTLNVFDVLPNGDLRNKRVIADFGDQLGIDGMTVDKQGRIYAAVRSENRFGVVVFSPQGKELAYLSTPELPTNCCFGIGDEQGTLYITAGKGFYQVQTTATGHHSATAIDAQSIGEILNQPVLDAHIPQAEVEDFCDARVPRMPKIETLDVWKKQAETLRRRVLDEVVFRGEAIQWRNAKCGVQWLDTIEGGPGYEIRKLRFEALPGLWIPGLLYMPNKIVGKVPAVMNVNGHDRKNGKAAEYKQMRCINQAKRGMIALNVEWLGMGQLNTPEFSHYRMNQLNLCGSSGIAPFYLAMSRGLDVLASLKETDPERVAVAGLSGGGWQTIFISSLDTRVKLCNPVAGYSSFLTRIHNHSDLGDSEQTPCDLATVADYAHLTAMLAPRAALLTFNIKDNCCFASPHALPPLLAAARPVYSLHKSEPRLAFHVNEDPGTHNYEKDNRQALYRMFKQHFYPNDDSFSTVEIESKKELKTGEELAVPLPDDNQSFQSLADRLSRNLPQRSKLPSSANAAKQWQAAGRKRLREIVRAERYECSGEKRKTSKIAGASVNAWRFSMQSQDAKQAEWTVPATEFVSAKPKGTTILLADGGRKTQAPAIAELVASGQRVVAVDPFYFGESKIQSRDFLFALLVSTVGQRPLGIQSAQIAAVTRWAAREYPGEPVAVVASGPRTSVIALVASALSPDSIAAVRLDAALGSLREVIEHRWDVPKTPELMCFGLLKEYDLVQIAALSAPRPVTFSKPSERVKTEMKPLVSFYKTVGGEFAGYDDR